MNISFIITWARKLAGALFSVLLCSVLGLAPTHAGVLVGPFELDGNTVDPSGAALPDDWESFAAGQAHTVRFTGITADTVPAVFRNGSKDIQDVSAWRYDLGSSPPKDDMKHGYAAAYSATASATSSAGDLLIYFGANRASFSGTASLGFWFFKNPIARNDATNSFVNPVTNQPATHAEGDVLIAFEYTNGGAVTEVRLFRWESGALADKGTIGITQTNVAGVFCSPDDKICGATNSGNLNIPWAGAIGAGQFFEGGVNLTRLLPGTDSCFAAFMATSRSSDQPNASIKNFILASFPVCHLSVTKQCESAVYQSATNNVLNTVKGQIVNDGGGALANISVTDNPPFNAGSVGFYTCDASGSPTNTPQSPASLPAGGSICYRGQTTSNTLTTSDTVTASASTGPGTVTGTASATCTASVNEALSVSKTCDVDLVAQNNQLAVKVNFSGSVTNNSSFGLTDVKVCEVAEAGAGVNPCDVAGHVEISVGNIDAGGVKAYNSTYYPNQALNAQGTSTLTDPHLAVFKDKVQAKGTKPAIVGGGTLTSMPEEATCPLCK